MNRQLRVVGVLLESIANWSQLAKLRIILVGRCRMWSGADQGQAVSGGLSARALRGESAAQRGLRTLGGRGSSGILGISSKLFAGRTCTNCRTCTSCRVSNIRVSSINSGSAVRAAVRQHHRCLVFDRVRQASHRPHFQFASARVLSIAIDPIDATSGYIAHSSF